jgi:hypothetical protein
MGELMIRCPKAGKAVTTGIYIERARFRSMPVFFSRSFCPSSRMSGLRGTHGSAIASGPPPWMDSHNQVEIVAGLERRVDQRHTACGAHGICIGGLAAINLCDHGRIAGRTPR